MVARRRRLFLLFVCVCILRVSSSRDATSFGVGARRQSTQGQSGRRWWNYDDGKRQLAIRTPRGPKTQSRLYSASSALSRCDHQHSANSACLPSSNPPTDLLLNDAATYRQGQILDGSSEQPETSSKKIIQTEDTVQSSSADLQLVGDRDNSSKLSTETSPPVQPDQPALRQSRSRNLLPSVRDARITRHQDASLVVHPSSRQRPLTTDADFRTSSSSTNAADDDDDDKEEEEAGTDVIANEKLDQGTARKPWIWNVLRQIAGGRSTQLYWQPPNRDVVESTSGRGRRRVRRGMWYAKRPRYYRNNDDYSSRRNWRVNLMRVWGKRHQRQQQQHELPAI